MIVIPMAGMSSRFFKAGYEAPKYQLIAHDKTLFEHAVESFKGYFDTMPFLFIVRDVHNTASFVKAMAKKLGIAACHVAVLNDETRGQAETVYLGLQQVSGYQGEITIFNIDTFRPSFEYPASLPKSSHGYLEVFVGEGDNWSFVLPEHEGSINVIETAEKRPISNLCCTGLYHFSSVDDYNFAYEYYLARPQIWEKGELYVAPLYNVLISKGRDIHYHAIDRSDVIFCGVPEEYETFKRTPQMKY
ncbi:glycosyltransferase family 2 protein [Enterovibrio sp. 27052020O]|uniref:glycosyltransferase family 2 protein n=1 Tax=Enterovibrio sp. 27052020O TaxID=3241166 RepID=UPI00388EF502